jgi:hypothetical protein
MDFMDNMDTMDCTGKLPLPLFSSASAGCPILDPAIAGDTAEQNRFPLPCYSPVTCHLSPVTSHVFLLLVILSTRTEKTGSNMADECILEIQFLGQNLQI